MDQRGHISCPVAIRNKKHMERVRGKGKPLLVGCKTVKVPVDQNIMLVKSQFGRTRSISLCYPGS